MDFSPTDEQVAIADLAQQIIGGSVDPDRLTMLEDDGVAFDAKLWSELVAAGLVGVAVPEEDGGAGLGMVELGLVLQAVGRHVAMVPLRSAALAAATLAYFGADGGAEHVAATLDGSARVTIGLEEFGSHDPAMPTTVATSDGVGWRVTGTKAVVPDVDNAAVVIVSATVDGVVGLFLVDPRSDGATCHGVDTTAHQDAANLVMENVAGVAVGAVDGTAHEWVLDRVQVGLAHQQVGIATGAIDLAADYLSTREQFGKPLGTFQAVAHRMADCHIRREAMRVTALQAAWALDHGDAGTAVLTAKWWATRGGQDVVHDVLHLHGGMGVDLDYPVHRYLLAGRDIAETLGGPAQDLDRLGAMLDHLPKVGM